MRPLRIRMQAFGPFAKMSEVDFRGLVDGGLFLIHGPTGAGKTSLLDGLCFSLFGRASGSERSPDGLRCDLAPIDRPTEVILEFALGKDVYRVVRRPRQTIRKQRGEGVTNSPPRGDLWKLDSASANVSHTQIDLDASDWSLIASGDKKTDERIAELLGMTEEQFRQVVVLPQGQFRKFLSANSDSREALLETLFRSESFRRISDRLDEKAKDLAAKITTARQGVAAQFSSLDVTTLDEVDAKLTEMKNRLEEIRSTEGALIELHRERAERRDSALAAAKVRSDLDTCEKRHRELETEREWIKESRHTLELEKRARPVLVIDARLQDVEREKSALEQDLSHAQTELAKADEEKATLEARLRDLAAREPEIEAAKRECDSLRQAFASAKSLIDERSKLAKTEKSLETARTNESHTASEVVRLETERKALETKFAELTETSRRRSALEAERTLIERELKTLETLGARFDVTLEKQNRLLDLRTRGEAARVSALNLATEAKRVRLEFHLSQAARIAEELEDGKPCPVCGSLDHPSKAALAKSAPSQSVVEAADLEAQKANEVASRLSIEAEALDAEIARDQVEIQSELETHAPSEAPKAGSSPTPLRDRIKLAIETQAKAKNAAKNAKTGEIEAASAAEREAETCRAKTAEITKRIEMASTALAAARTSLQDLRIVCETSKSKIDQLESLVPETSRNLEEITARGQRLAGEIKIYQDTLVETNRLAESARHRSSSSRATAETLTKQISSKKEIALRLEGERSTALAASGFASIEDCRKAGLEPERFEALDRSVREFDKSSATVGTRLAELKLEWTKVPEWAWDLDARNGEYAIVDQDRRQRQIEKGTIEAQVRLLSLAREKASTQLGEISELESRYKIAGRLAEVAAGRPPNNSRVSFQRFVLAAQLDEVLEQASRRLFDMSRGQFTLKRSRAIDDKRKSGGLELEVDDSFTGTARPTSSLSGGEGFQASLALALGLADVVQMHLGGVRLDAIFVDEGFGTLDSEALDASMKILSELQAGGRLVGIISHVPELKDQIARRLRVRKGPEGSAIDWEISLGFEFPTSRQAEL